MKSWGSVVGRRPLAVLLLSLLVVAASAVWGVGVFDTLKNGGFDDPASESYIAHEKQIAHFGDTEPDVVLLYSDPDRQATDPGFIADARQALAALPTDAIQQTVPYWATKDPAMVGDDGHAGMVVLTLNGRTQDEKTNAYQALAEAGFEADGLQTDVAGQWAVFDDVSVTAGEDIARAEMVALPIVFVLSLLVFGSLVAALMPTLVGAVAVLGAFAILHTLASVTEVSIFALNVVTLLGMGLAIDYALFIVTRFRKELDRQPDGSRASAAAAMRTTMATSGRTVMFSGLLVAASLSSLLIFPQVFLRSMGMGGVAAVVVAMLAALTLLPAVLVLLGRRVELGRVPLLTRLARRGEGHGVWSRIAHGVMARPITVLAGCVALLALLGAPFLGVNFGGTDHRMLPTDAPSVQAMAQRDAWFGEAGSQASVVLEGRGVTQTALAAYVADLEGLRSDVRTQVVERTGSGAELAALVRLSWSGEPQAAESQQLVRDIRQVTVPGAQSWVGGSSAQTVDLLRSVGSRLPLMGAIVAGVMFLLLFLAFGSVVLPLKAIAVNVLSLGASFGVVTWIFAQGHLEGLLGFTSPGYLDATQPILMLAILFGLSMDYEVFLLSRVKEEWDASPARDTAANTRAVAEGLEHTGGLITSAALLLMVVVGGFATSGLVMIKMIGVGMFVAILVDATIIRTLVVPATMRLLGRWNWWAPSPLRRVANRVALEH